MLKKSVIFGMCLSGLLLTTAFSVEPGTVVVHGKAAIERRFTRVPLELCNRGIPCEVPQIFWNLVVYSDQGSTYELEQHFDQGSTDSPAQVEVNGVEIRAGDEVTLDAEVSQIADHAWIFDKVSSVQVGP